MLLNCTPKSAHQMVHGRLVTLADRAFILIDLSALSILSTNQSTIHSLPVDYPQSFLLQQRLFPSEPFESSSSPVSYTPTLHPYSDFTRLQLPALFSSYNEFRLPSTAGPSFPRCSPSKRLSARLWRTFC